MGTSIHLFIEYDRDQSSIPFSVAGNIRSLSLAELWLPNDYKLFDALAGGRSHTLGVVEKPPMFRPRGLPTPISLEVYYRYYYVVEDPKYRDAKYDKIPKWIAPLGSVTEAIATEWIEKGWSTLAPSENHSQGRPRRHRVSGPNWHTASWLLLSEIGLSIEFYDIAEELLSYEMIAHLSAMRILESHLGPSRTRIVFWFDN